MDRRNALAVLLGTAGAGLAVRFNTSGSESPTRVKGVSAAPPPRQLPTAGPIRSLTIAPVPIGGGGFVTGLDVSHDGARIVCRTDVANAYVRDRQDLAWRPLFSPATMKRDDYEPPLAANGKADGNGVAGIRIAPSDPDTIVASYNGYIWISRDGGRSIERSRLAQHAMPANAGRQRLFNSTIDIHPSDPRTILVGTCGDGAWSTADGGRTWSRADLPDAGKSLDGMAGLHLVLFDQSMPRRTYIFVTGVGLHRCDESPSGGYRLVAGGPIHCSNLVAGADGLLLLCEPSGTDSGRFWRYDPATGWASSRAVHEALVVAQDPAHPSHLVAANENGFFMTSIDMGATWTELASAWNREAGEVGWLRELSTLFPAELRYDPSAPGRLLVAHGAGVARRNLASREGPLEDWSAGIEELCTVAVLIVPGGRTFLSGWDKSFWRVDDWTSYSNRFHFPVPVGRKHDPNLVAYGSYLDYAGDDPRVIVGIVAVTNASGPGLSIDGGETWRAFPGKPDTGWGMGGCIAASTRRNFVLLPSNNGVGSYTLDGGASWRPVKLDGVTPTAGFANAYYVQRKNVAADKTVPGTFVLVYTVVHGDGYGEPLGGVWLTRDGGASWQQMLKGVIGEGSHDPRAVRANGLEERQFWRCQLDYVPGQRGELLYTPHADYQNDRLFWSRDDGRSWRDAHSAIRNVKAFGFGKSAPGQSRPAVYFWGEVKGRPGLYASFDWFTSVPILLVAHPSPAMADIACVSGDPDRFGRIILGTDCAGWLRVDVGV